MMFGVRKKTTVPPIRRADENFLFRGRGVVRFRPVLFLSLSFGLGIFFAFLCGMFALVGASAFLLAAAGALVYRLVKKRSVLPFLLFSLLLCLFYVLGCLSFSMRVGDFEDSPEITGECSVAGTVEEIGDSASYMVLTVSDLWVIDGDGNELSPDSGLQLYIFGGSEDARIGAGIMFDAEVETYDAWSYGRINANAIIGNIRYRASVTADKVTFSEGKGVGFFTSLRRYVRELLSENLDGQTAAVAYGLLTGDSGYMDEDILQNFRYGGIAHIFAVSGLHIGIIYGLMNLLCRALKLKNVVRLPLVFAALCFYAGFCGFSPSAVRALIMCTILMLLEAGGFQYDRVGSVACASLAVLIIHPVYLFSAGFQLSVAAAAGIVIVGGHLTRLLQKVRFLPRKVCSAVGVSLSAQLATFPILIDCFGYVSGISFFLNLLFVPLIGMVYAVLFCGVVLACLFPFGASVLLYIPGFLLSLCVLPVYVLDFKVLLVCGFSFGACAVLWYMILFLLTDKVNLKPVPKLSLSAMLCVFLSVAMLFQNGVFQNGAVLSLHSGYDSNVALYRGEDGDYLISFGAPDEGHIEQLFLKEGIRSLKGAVILADADTVNTSVPMLLQFADIGAVYVPGGSELIDTFRTVDICYEEGIFSFGGAYAEFYSEEVLYLNVNGADVVCDACGEEIPLKSCDLLISSGEESAILQECAAQMQICFAKSQEKISVYRAGDLQISWENGIISVRDAG